MVKKIYVSLTRKMLKNTPLCTFFPKMSAYIRDFDETKHMSFLMQDDKLWEKYNQIWEKVKHNIKKEFDSEPLYDEKISES